jgi:integrase
MGWEFQDNVEIEKMGSRRAKWYAGWRGVDGKRHAKRIGSRSMARKYWQKMERQRADDLCSDFRKIAWKEFLGKYRETEMSTWRSPRSRMEADHVFELFTEVAKPVRVDSVDANMLDRYVARRFQMRGRKRGDTVAASTIKKELRTIRAALNKAKRWRHVALVPDMPEVEGFERDKPFVTEEHFDQMMANCSEPHLPDDQHYVPHDFWQALLAVLWVTGMRKSALISLLWEDVDLDSGKAWSRAEDNKAKREEWKDIGPAVSLLRVLYSLRNPGEPRVFPWNYSLRTMDRELHRIQKAAGIRLPCREKHEHTAACHVYGFHSFRYAHATYNHGNPRLQQQMGHASETMTKHYIKYAEAHQQDAYNAYLTPALRVLQKGTG